MNLGHQFTLGFVVVIANVRIYSPEGQALAYIYFEDERGRRLAAVRLDSLGLIVMAYKQPQP